MKKRIVILLLAMTFTTAVFTACGEKTSDTAEQVEEKTLQVTTVDPLETEINITGDFVGTLEYSDQVDVFPLISGEITKVYFEEGDYVEAGQLMFTLDDKAYQLQLKNANATYTQAEIGMNQQLGALQMQRNSNLNNIDAANEGVRQIEDTYKQFDSQLSDLGETKEDMQKDRADLKQDLIDLRKDKEKAEDNLKSAKSSLEDASKAYANAMTKRAQEEAAHNADPSIPITVTDSQLQILKGAMDGASAQVSGLTQQIAGYASAETQLESAIKQYDSSMDSLDSSKDNLQFQKDSLDYNYAQAKRGVILAQENLDYFDKYTVPATEQNAANTLNQASIGIDSAKLQLSYTKVKAPVSGKVLVRNNDEKDLAQAGYPVYSILPESTIYASFGVPESVWRELELGDEVIVSKNDKEYKGKISELPTEVDQRTGLFTIKAAIGGNTDDLITGTAVTVKAVTKHIDKTMTIPIDCVYYEGGNSYTFSVSDNGIVSKVYIETGMYDKDNMQILSGVNKDMKIISTWSSDLHDGIKVDILGATEDNSTENKDNKVEDTVSDNNTNQND